MDNHLNITLFFSLGTALFFGINPILIKKGLKIGGDQTRGTFYLLCAHLLSMFLLLILFDSSDQGAWQLGNEEIIWLSMAGISNFVLAFNYYFKSIAVMGAARTASIVNANPGVSVILAVLLLGENINSTAWLGIFLILVGAYIIGRR
jgi:drug/metabolite transporter (DMT)-like permease